MSFGWAERRRCGSPGRYLHRPLPSRVPDHIGESSPPLPERSAPPRIRRCSSAGWRGRARLIRAPADRAWARAARGRRGR
jgi:hypothetical protein